MKANIRPIYRNIKTVDDNGDIHYRRILDLDAVRYNKLVNSGAPVAIHGLAFREFAAIHPVDDRKDFRAHPRPRHGKTRFDAMKAPEREAARKAMWRKHDAE